MKSIHTTRTIHTTSKPRMSWGRRVAVVPLALALAVGASACGDDVTAEDTDEDVVAGEAGGTDPISIEEDASLEGLEVTITGNIDEQVDRNAFRVDKDGLGGEDGPDIGDLPDQTDDLDFVNDANYYDYDAYTNLDDEFGEGEEQGVLVFDPSASPVVAEQAVQVTGTLRRFDEETIESFYDVDLDDALFDDFEQEYMLIADSVKAVDAVGTSATATPTATDAATPAATDTATPTATDAATPAATDTATPGPTETSS